MINSIIAWISALILSVISFGGYWGVFFLMAVESFNIPAPSEIIMPFAGFLVSQGKLAFWLVVMSGVFGNLIGSIANYFLGYYGGRAFLIKFGKYFLVHERDLVKAERWFKKFGASAVFFGRMMPVIRTFISLPAGIAEMPLAKFCIYTFLGALPWNIALAYLGIYLGDRWDILHVWFQKLDWLFGGLMIILLAWWIIRHFKNTPNEQI